jgi:hypothetical protein
MFYALHSYAFTTLITFMTLHASLRFTTYVLRFYWPFHCFTFYALRLTTHQLLADSRLRFTLYVLLFLRLRLKFTL